jgi:hypothetical protein
MTEQARLRELGNAVTVARSEQLGVQSYRRARTQARRGRAGDVDSASPLEFDESGFPIPQRNHSFLARVARLLSS